MPTERPKVSRANESTDQESAALITSKVFHSGELAVQHRAGAPSAIHRFAETAIRGHLIEQHREFFARLPFLVIAAADRQGNPWCSLLVGEPGFARALDDASLTVSHDLSHGDPLLSHLTVDAHVGLLGIELHSRRRNRLNGRIASLSRPGQFIVNVEQSYGNCPKYITPRSVEAWPRIAGPTQVFEHFTAPSIALIRGADTFFIASGYVSPDAGQAAGFDASHRGGSPGFVEVDSDTELTFPDYPGNNLFNTLGNVSQDPRVGLLFVDFRRGTLLHLTGRVAIDWDSSRLASFRSSSGATAQRLLTFRLDRGVLRHTVLPLRFTDA